MAAFAYDHDDIESDIPLNDNESRGMIAHETKKELSRTSPNPNDYTPPIPFLSVLQLPKE